MNVLGDKTSLPNLNHKELVLLLELGERLVSELELEKVLMLVAETACQVVQAETLVVPIIDQDRQTFTYRAASGKYAEMILGQTFPIHEGSCGWVMQHQQPLLFGESDSFELEVNARWQPGMASNLLVPLICRGTIAGGLSAMGKRGGGAFNQRDLAVLTLFANQASIAIDNAKLFHDLNLEESRLRASEQRFRTLFNNAEVAMFRSRLNGSETLDCNDKFLEIVGRTREEIIGKPSVIYWKSPQKREEMVRQLNAEGRVTDFEFGMLNTKGELRHCVTSLKLFREEGMLEGTIMDITERQRATQELALVNFAMNHIKEAAYLADEQGCFHYVNDEACRVMGYRRDELLKLRVIDVDTVSTRQEQWAANWELLKSQKSATFESRHINRDGSDFPVEINANYFEFLGQPYILGLVRDITERKRTESIVEQYRTVIHASLDGFWITDTSGRILDVNEAICRMYGYSRDELLRLSISDIEVDETPEEIAARIREIVKTGHAQFETRHKRKDGSIANVEISIQYIANLGDRLFAFIRDISRLKAHEAELRHVAHYDALTGIPNRVLLADRMKQAIAQTAREQNMMAICYLDLDGFKPINDTMGHDVGDLVLIEVAKRIGNTIRGGDTVARLGGDEFVALLLGLEKGEECAATLERLLATIVQPITVKNKSSIISASIGVSIYPLDHEDPDTLLRHADQAMYQAKQSGKNRFHIYDPALDQRARDQHEFMKSIRNGLKNDQFELFYQPKINLHTKELVGVEALIRWRHPERGLLSPAAFLRHIENTYLDIEIGEWVTATALAQMNHWRNSGLDIEVSINISGYHMESLGFVEKLQQQIAHYPKMPMGKLQIEVLETVALNDIAIVRGIIEACRKFGVGFALDDFGTGYSSLSYLSSLPVDVLKIDQSFVRDMLEDKGDMAIVQGIIALARAFDRQTVAEGIETEEHYQILLNMGCELGQGYYIARPMQADELTNWKVARKDDL